MKVVVTNNHEESCRKTADIIIDVVKNHANPVLGLATGGTAEKVYDELVLLYQKKEVSFSHVETVNLDEYVGLAPEHDQSYSCFMNKFFFDRVDIDKNKTFLPIGNKNHQEELKKFQARLASKPRNFQLLGIGANGHIAFNEPAGSLHADAHIVDIADETIKANSRYFASEADVPKQAFTQGMGNILKAERIVLLATGAAKADAVKALVFGDEVTTQMPCTFLKLHPNVTVFIDKELADMIGFKS
ncbi:MAG: glucosamine-6-phosphate deaminase [Brevinemataceae bacterium]